MLDNSYVLIHQVSKVTRTLTSDSKMSWLIRLYTQIKANKRTSLGLKTETENMSRAHGLGHNFHENAIAA